MPRRIKAAVILLAAGLAIAVAWLLVAVRDTGGPAFDGRPLSYWLARTQGGFTNEQELHAAMDHVGTNALPFLLKWIRYERPQWRDTLFQEAPESLEDLAIGRAELRADASEEALTYLGTNAAAALRELALIARDTNAPETAERAMSALASIGPSGIQVLLTIAGNTNNPNWSRALAKAAGTPLNNPFQPFKVAALVKLIGENNPPAIRQASVHFLGQQIAVPALALPPLMNCITNDSSDSNMRIIAIVALRRFGPCATSTLPVLTNALIDPSPTVRSAASSTINEILHPTLSPILDRF